jgi:hypothetical protein
MMCKFAMLAALLVCSGAENRRRSVAVCVFVLSVATQCRSCLLALELRIAEPFAVFCYNRALATLLHKKHIKCGLPFCHYAHGVHHILAAPVDVL